MLWNLWKSSHLHYSPAPCCGGSSHIPEFHVLSIMCLLRRRTLSWNRFARHLYFLCTVSAWYSGSFSLLGFFDMFPFLPHPECFRHDDNMMNFQNTARHSDQIVVCLTALMISLSLFFAGEPLTILTTSSSFTTPSWGWATASSGC